MVNCNPETVSTDYDTSDRLYFEPLTFEDVLEIIDKEKPEGVIVQYGGQTPLKLARALEAAGAPIIGTTPDSIDLAEDRERFQQLVKTLGLKQPPNATARTEEQAVQPGARSRLPAGRAAVVRARRPRDGSRVQRGRSARLHDRRGARCRTTVPVLLDRFLDLAIEVDVDAICDGDGRADRRHHGAHRAGRRAFRRFGLLAAAEQPERGAAGRAARADAEAGAKR